MPRGAKPILSTCAALEQAGVVFLDAQEGSGSAGELEQMIGLRKIIAVTGNCLAAAVLVTLLSRA